MLPSLLAALTTGEWLVTVGSGLVLLLSAAPFVWLMWRFLAMSDSEVARAIAEANERPTHKTG
jgi:hypothetical protein